MYQITLVPTNSQTNIALLFKSEATAKAEMQNIKDRLKEYYANNNPTHPIAVTSKDDYGQVSHIEARSIAFLALFDVRSQDEAAGEKAFIRAQAQKRTNDRVASDPLLSGQINLNRGGVFQ